MTPPEFSPVVAGGGIAGLAASIALLRAGIEVRQLEQSQRWAEVGAGLQLGPNAVRVLADWGLMDVLRACAAFPKALVARDARSGHTLGQVPLGARAQARYGQPYATVHRADLHQLLVQALAGQAGHHITLGRTVLGWQAADADAAVQVQLDDGTAWHTPLLLGCDGLWSRVRQPLLGDDLPTPSGHIAYRGLVDQSAWPDAQRLHDVVAWLGPRMHAVTYPVRSGRWVNVVVIVEGRIDDDVQNWSHAAELAELLTRTGPLGLPLRQWLDAVPQWLRWPLFERAQLTHAGQMGAGRVALLGDAAHPMRPYLAQGAAMALEDAWALGRLLAAQSRPLDEPQLWLAQWAQARWRRNAWVQRRARRNGRVFHLAPPWSWARNLGLALLDRRLMDVPALYAGPPGL